MLRTITELTLVIIGIWTIDQLWDMPKEIIKSWKRIKKAQGLQSHKPNKKITYCNYTTYRREL